MNPVQILIVTALATSTAGCAVGNTNLGDGAGSPDAGSATPGHDGAVDGASPPVADAARDGVIGLTTDASMSPEASDAATGSNDAAAPDASEAAPTEAASVDAPADSTADASTDALADAPPTMQTVTLVRIGDGAAALSSASTAVFLETRRVSDGSLVGAPIALPTAASGTNQPFSNSGSANSEGDVTLSADGHYVVLAGYASAPGTASIASTSSAMVPRVVARVDSSGMVDTTTALGNAFDGNNVRGAASFDGTAFWLAGTATSTGGIEYAPLGATMATQVLASPANTRRVNVFAGQLYASSGSGAFDGVLSVGTGLPTAVGAAGTILPGFPTTSGPSPYAFVAFDLDANVPGIDRIYVSDDRAPSSGGVQKWTSDGATWTLTATLDAGLTSGTRGVTGS